MNLHGLFVIFHMVCALSRPSALLFFVDLPFVLIAVLTDVRRERMENKNFSIIEGEGLSVPTNFSQIF